MVQPNPDVALVRHARKIYRELGEVYSNAKCALDFATPFQLLTAVIHAAQSTDVGVNKVTPALFAKYPTPADLAAANPAELEALIRPTGDVPSPYPAVVAGEARRSACVSCDAVGAVLRSGRCAGSATARRPSLADGLVSEDRVFGASGEVGAECGFPACVDFPGSAEHAVL